MTSTDYRAILLEERERVEHSLKLLHVESPSSNGDETDEETPDNHVGDAASITLAREIDNSLEEQPGPCSRGDRPRSEANRGGDIRNVRGLREDDRGGAPGGDAVRNEVHRVQAPRREGLTNPAPRLIDVRVGSATDGRVPISMAARSLSARPFHWLALFAVAFAALAADQLTKQLVVTQLALGRLL